MHLYTSIANLCIGENKDYGDVGEGHNYEGHIWLQAYIAGIYLAIISLVIG